jgi:hypothetical protein
LNDADWKRLIDQLSHGDCTPFLGAGACAGVLPNGANLSKEWAQETGYPFDNPDELARVMQYAVFVNGRDSTYLKQQVCGKLKLLPPPDFSRSTEPHALLAEFPLPVFITTNYDDYLKQALLLAGKAPRVALCPWYDQTGYDSRLFDSAEELEDDGARPLVYHLHGSWQEPMSLVLTERDYLEFLVNMAEARGGDDRRLIPEPILTALTNRPLLFIGYSLQDWTFLVLFHGLLRGIPGIRRRRHVSVQMPPPLNDQGEEAQDRAKKYLTNSLEDWDITIYWGTAEDFCTKVRYWRERLA